MSNFETNALNIITDLLRLLQEKSSEQNFGDASSGKETAQSTLLRLLGVKNEKDFQIQGDKNNKESVSSAPLESLLANFFKVQNQPTRLQLVEINKLLKSFKKRLLRYSKTRQQIKLNRIKNLVNQPQKPINSESLVKDTPEQTKKAIDQESKKLINSRDFTGVLEQEIALQRAIELSQREITNIPEATGEMRSQLQRILRGASNEADDRIEELQNYKKELESEVYKLENIEKLLFSGVDTFAGGEDSLALINVVDLLIFLTDRSKMRYDCSQCKFYREGKTNACTFAGEGTQANTPLVNFTDATTGSQVVGRQTLPTNSCKQVWGLDQNTYYQPSDSLVDSLEEILTKKQ